MSHPEVEFEHEDIGVDIPEGMHRLSTTCYYLEYKHMTVSVSYAHSCR